MKLSIWTRFMLILSILSLASTSWGSNKREELLKQEARPTIEQINQVFPYNPQSASIDPDIAISLPKLIASFERAFPGATFYELGRDAVYLGDMLDAFYTSIGQPNRIKRLDASNTSFTPDDKITNDFLKSSGIDVTKLTDDNAAVVFDTTSFSHRGGVGSAGASQSVLVIRSGYSAYVKSGGNPKDLIKRFNFISIGGFYKRIDEVDFDSSEFNLDQFFAYQKSTASEFGFEMPLYIDGSRFSYAHAEWHPMFERFEKQEDGETRAPIPPSYSSSFSSRDQILDAMIEARDTVMTPEFMKMVELEALLLGYKFPTQRTTRLEFLPDSVVQKARKAIAEVKRKQAEAKAKAELDRNKQKRKKLNLSKLAEEYFSLIDIKVIGSKEDPKSAIQFILEDLKTSSDLERWTDNDLLGFLKLFYASVMAYESDGMIKQLGEISQIHRRFENIVLQNNIRESHIGSTEFSYRIEENQRKLKKLLGGSAEESKSCPDILKKLL